MGGKKKKKRSWGDGFGRATDGRTDGQELNLDVSFSESFIRDLIKIADSTQRWLFSIRR
jgi:hypothetical protein